jgi:thiol-disulfide isomerase/thioredoxin
MKKRLLVLPVVLTALLAALPSQGWSRATEDNVGKEMPKMSHLKFVENEPKTLDETPMIVEFWATWCPPCRTSIPHLNEIHEKFKDKGLVVIGVTDETRSKIRKFMEEVPMHYAVARDSKNKLAKEFGVKGIPHALVVDKSGKIVWEGHPKSLKDKDIEPVLSGAPESSGDDAEKKVDNSPGPKTGFY